MGKEYMREIREALLATGCDRTALKLCQKKYDRYQKLLPQVREQYRRARASTVRVEKIAREMEALIVQGQTDDREGKKVFSELIKEMKRLQNGFDNEFLISREDKEFHSTYDSIIRLGAKALDDSEQRLVLQSEIENLLSLLRENLEKNRPHSAALAAFYLEHTDGELVNLPPAKRIELVAQVYHRDFYQPMEELLMLALPLAESRADELVKREDRRALGELEHIAVLLQRPGRQEPLKERAGKIIEQLLK